MTSSFEWFIHITVGCLLIPSASKQDYMSLFSCFSFHDKIKQCLKPHMSSYLTIKHHRLLC